MRLRAKKNIDKMSGKNIPRKTDVASALNETSTPGALWGYSNGPVQ